MPNTLLKNQREPTVPSDDLGSHESDTYAGTQVSRIKIILFYILAYLIMFMRI